MAESFLGRSVPIFVDSTSDIYLMEQKQHHEEINSFITNMMFYSKSYFAQILENEILQQQLQGTFQSLISFLLDTTSSITLTFLNSLVKEHLQHYRHLDKKAAEAVKLILRAAVVFYAYKYEAVFSLERITVVDHFLDTYPEFAQGNNVDNLEQENLLNFCNFLKVAFSIFGHHRHKHKVIQICAFLEGSDYKYSVGSYKSVAALRRETIYRKEAGLVESEKSDASIADESSASTTENQSKKKKEEREILEDFDGVVTNKRQKRL